MEERDAVVIPVRPGGRSMGLLMITLLLTAVGSGPDSAMASGKADSTLTKRLSWSVLPIIFSSPDTDWAFGVLPQVVFRLPNTERQSRVFVAGYYTLNRQYAVSTVGSFWFNENRDNVEVKAENAYWPTTFYGFASVDHAFETADYTEREFGVAVSANRQYGSTFRIGVQASVQRLEITDFDTNLDPEPVVHLPGDQGGWIVGLGPTVGIDSRDQVFYPTTGWYAVLSLLSYGYVFGGDYDFLAFQGDFRTYRKISGNHVIAAQARIDLTTDGVPFWGMSGVGSVVRGYSSMRYLDSQMAAGQIEYRIHPLLWRVGIAVFAGAGVVGRRVDDLFSSRIRPAAGLGLRFAFMEDAKINIRWDFGWGEGTSGDYLDMGEAF